MSRTKRKTFYDDNPGRRLRDAEDWWSYRGRDKERDKYFNGRDGAHGGYSEPCSKSPHGYNTWCDHSGNSRWAKRAAARVIRNRYKKFVLEEVRLLEVGDDEVVYKRGGPGKKMPREERYRLRNERQRERFEVRRQTNLDSNISVRDLLRRCRLDCEVKMLKIQLKAIYNTWVDASLLASLQAEADVLEEKIARKQFQIRSIRGK